MSLTRQVEKMAHHNGGAQNGVECLQPGSVGVVRGVECLTQPTTSGGFLTAPMNMEAVGAFGAVDHFDGLQLSDLQHQRAVAHAELQQLEVQAYRAKRSGHLKVQEEFLDKIRVVDENRGNLDLAIKERIGFVVKKQPDVLQVKEDDDEFVAPPLLSNLTNGDHSLFHNQTSSTTSTSPSTPSLLSNGTGHALIDMNRGLQGLNLNDGDLLGGAMPPKFGSLGDPEVNGSPTRATSAAVTPPHPNSNGSNGIANEVTNGGSYPVSQSPPFQQGLRGMPPQATTANARMGAMPENGVKSDAPYAYKYKTLPCKFFRSGYCRNGDACTYRHDHPRSCKNLFENKYCERGPKCGYSHDLPVAQNNLCYGYNSPDGCSWAACRFLHVSQVALNEFPNPASQ